MRLSGSTIELSASDLPGSPHFETAAGLTGQTCCVAMTCRVNLELGLMRLSTPSSRKKPGAAPVWQHNRPLALHKICNEARQRYRTTRYHDATETNCTPKMTFFIPPVLNQTAAARLRCKIMIRPGGTRHPQGLYPWGKLRVTTGEPDR